MPTSSSDIGLYEAKICAAIQVFVEVESSADYAAALDILRKHTLLFRRSNLFPDVVTAAAFLAEQESEALRQHLSSKVLLAAGLDHSKVDAAQAHARRFLSSRTP